MFEGRRSSTPLTSSIVPKTGVKINKIDVKAHGSSSVLIVQFESKADLTAQEIDRWWWDKISKQMGQATLIAARPARPGYVLSAYDTSRKPLKYCDFNVYCPDPDCELNRHHSAELVPLNRNVFPFDPINPRLIDDSPEWAEELPQIKGMQWENVPNWAKHAEGVACFTPIPAYTVDDQIYHRCPSVVIATVDKIARLAYEPKAASIFGNVNSYHSRWGYYRDGTPPMTDDSNLPINEQAHIPADMNRILHVAVNRFRPPDLIIQDELHLIEGPLGSMVGLYETVVELLCRYKAQNQVGKEGFSVPKYVASTATVRQAASQVQSLFSRQICQFPSSGVNADDRFFAVTEETHPLDCMKAGRLYIGICAPGRGAQTPIVRLWAGLLQASQTRRSTGTVLNEDLDPFWTLVGYFNAIRELSGAVALYRQDIIERIGFRGGKKKRSITAAGNNVELSGRTRSLSLPSILDDLGRRLPHALDALFTTSMFGTGVDVSRLGLMVVHGQPKTTATYIQATGRVGRESGGLVVTFCRASRPRDLDHYEFFTGYHRALYRYVEPVTIAPFSPRARERALGPLAVVLLRQSAFIEGKKVDRAWRIQQRLTGGRFVSHAGRMTQSRNDPEVLVIPSVFETRAAAQPEGRRPIRGITERETASELDRWRMIASHFPDEDAFVYYEPSYSRLPKRRVVLGDSQHFRQDLDQVYENVPGSLRDVEETTTFGDL